MGVDRSGKMYLVHAECWIYASASRKNTPVLFMSIATIITGMYACVSTLPPSSPFDVLIF